MNGQERVLFHAFVVVVESEFIYRIEPITIGHCVHLLDYSISGQRAEVSHLFATYLPFTKIHTHSPVIYPCEKHFICSKNAYVCMKMLLSRYVSHSSVFGCVFFVYQAKNVCCFLVLRQCLCQKFSQKSALIACYMYITCKNKLIGSVVFTFWVWMAYTLCLLAQKLVFIRFSLWCLHIKWKTITAKLKHIEQSQANCPFCK